MRLDRMTVEMVLAGVPGLVTDPSPSVYLGPPVLLEYTVVGVDAGDLDHIGAISFSRLACITSSARC